jgi:hypothetical protein
MMKMTEKSTMIVEHFPAPVPTPVVTKHRMPQQQHPVMLHPLVSKLPNPFVKTELERAKARGLEPEEYRKRVEIVTKASNSCIHQIGDTIWPIDKDEREKYGRCLITDICRHYDSYGSVDWVEAAPLLLTLKPQNIKDTFITAPVNWGVKQITYELENEGESC